MVTIRFFTPDDLLAVCELATYFELSPYQVDPEFRQLSTVKVPFLITHNLSNPDIITLIAENDDKQVIGFISFVFEKNMVQFLESNFQNKDLFASILFLSVNQKYRCQGIGKLLLKSCLKYLKDQGIYYIRIGTDYGNFQALSLYQKVGFKLSMLWHIYRIYKKELKYQSSNIFKDWKNCDDWSENPEIFLRRRPIPWYYDPQSSKQQIYYYILERFEEQLSTKKLITVQKQINNKSLGIILQRDIFLEQGYQLKGYIYHITDLLESPSRGEFLSEFLKDTFLELPNLLMAEIWIPSHDYLSQKIVQKAGMKFCYGGISLFLNLLNHTDK
ncbi:Ribosomal protein S18 acetylase RimI [Brevinema andersonii]|uniref:Ribosomal protein S18 acetylase RimI n=1 Tax=Brevinema andersonii TaxID=34097 RepID=A0A1I1EK62_BREAD|nr:GNAT family N-acetyltransferase [Brevinema andersonii]SFB87495.1 Ribosomal protein S18 acetylase RimI [Brevinema andersonii]